MRSLAFLTTGVLVLIAIAPACGASVSSSCAEYFDALLSVQTQCGAPDVLFTESERSDYIAACEAAAAALGSSNAAGQLDQCANDTKARGCIAIVYSPPSCFVRGGLSDGSPCGTNQQCAGGVCAPSQTTDPSSEVACGVCASFLAVGTACSFGVFPPCDPATGDCDGNTCVAFIPHGAPCPQSNTYCAPGDECTDHGICDTVPTLGQSCNLDCNGPYDCTNGTCVARPSQQPPPVGVGATCGYQSSGAPCDAGLVCSLHMQTCIVPVPLGAACTVGAFQCSPFAACINGACAVPDYTACK